MRSKNTILYDFFNCKHQTQLRIVKAVAFYLSPLPSPSSPSLFFLSPVVSLLLSSPIFSQIQLQGQLPQWGANTL